MNKILKMTVRGTAALMLLAFTVGSFGVLPPTTHAVDLPNADVTTNPATLITSNDATLNGVNGAMNSTEYSFWVSLNTFSTDSSTSIPEGVYSTGVDYFGANSAHTSFSKLLSSAINFPPVTSSTTYYFVAWSLYDGSWHHGDIMNFTTLPSSTNGTISGTVTGGAGVGILSVTSIQTVTANATANGTFANGWKYVFNITVPTDEPNLAMKFADWQQSGGSGTIAVANNMRISSAQANNSGATVLLTGANTYSSPTLHMTSDLDANTDGMQVQVTVETSIPLNSSNGTYSTSYGVKTN